MTKTETVDVLLRDKEQTFASEIGIPLEKNEPQPLFRWLVAAILYANPIQHELATRAARALGREGLRGANQINDASWKDLAHVLGSNGYAQYDERTASILKDASAYVCQTYNGDLRRLREAAGKDPAAERKALKEVKGVGDVAVNVFFREVQAVWDELYPFADDVTLAEADRLGLGKTVKTLEKRVERPNFPRLVAALTRSALGDNVSA